MLPRPEARPAEEPRQAQDRARAESPTTRGIKDWKPKDESGDLGPSQFGPEAQATGVASSICGPIAAVQFAARYGRAPSVAEAVALARQTGTWDEVKGMHGPGSESALLDSMGVPNRLDDAPSRDAVIRDVTTGNPVILSSPNYYHYFVASGYDPETGLFDTGNTGEALKGGSRWRSWDDINPQAALFVDEPSTPVASQAVDTYGGSGTGRTPGGTATTGRTYASEGQADRAAVAQVAQDARANPPSINGRMDPQEFTSTLLPLAIAHQYETGIPASFYIAAAAHESGWGGAGNTLFGIKGPGATFATYEVENGQDVAQDASFRTYNNAEEAFTDFDNLVTSGRYAPAYEAFRQHGDAHRFWTDITQAGYATDQSWGDKINNMAVNTVEPLIANDPNGGLAAPPADSGAQHSFKLGMQAPIRPPSRTATPTSEQARDDYRLERAPSTTQSPTQSPLLDPLSGFLGGASDVVRNVYTSLAPAERDTRRVTPGGIPTVTPSLAGDVAQSIGGAGAAIGDYLSRGDLTPEQADAMTREREAQQAQFNAQIPESDFTNQVTGMRPTLPGLGDRSLERTVESIVRDQIASRPELRIGFRPSGSTVTPTFATPLPAAATLAQTPFQGVQAGLTSGHYRGGLAEAANDADGFYRSFKDAGASDDAARAGAIIARNLFDPVAWGTAGSLGVARAGVVGARMLAATTLLNGVIGGVIGALEEPDNRLLGAAAGASSLALLNLATMGTHAPEAARGLLDEAARARAVVARGGVRPDPYLLNLFRTRLRDVLKGTSVEAVDQQAYKAAQVATEMRPDLRNAFLRAFTEHATDWASGLPGEARGTAAAQRALPAGTRANGRPAPAPPVPRPEAPSNATLGYGAMTPDEPSRFGLPSLANDLATRNPRIEGGGQPGGAHVTEEDIRAWQIQEALAPSRRAYHIGSRPDEPLGDAHVVDSLDWGETIPFYEGENVARNMAESSLRPAHGSGINPYAAREEIRRLESVLADRSTHEDPWLLAQIDARIAQLRASFTVPPLREVALSHDLNLLDADELPTSAQAEAIRRALAARGLDPSAVDTELSGYGVFYELVREVGGRRGARLVLLEAGIQGISEGTGRQMGGTKIVHLFPEAAQHAQDPYTPERMARERMAQEAAPPSSAEQAEPEADAPLSDREYLRRQMAQQEQRLRDQGLLGYGGAEDVSPRVTPEDQRQADLWNALAGGGREMHLPTYRLGPDGEIRPTPTAWGVLVELHQSQESAQAMADAQARLSLHGDTADARQWRQRAIDQWKEWLAAPVPRTPEDVAEVNKHIAEMEAIQAGRAETVQTVPALAPENPNLLDINRPPTGQQFKAIQDALDRNKVGLALYPDEMGGQLWKQINRLGGVDPQAIMREAGIQGVIHRGGLGMAAPEIVGLFPEHVRLKVTPEEVARQKALPEQSPEEVAADRERVAADIEAGRRGPNAPEAERDRYQRLMVEARQRVQSEGLLGYGGADEITQADIDDAALTNALSGRRVMHHARITEEDTHTLPGMEHAEETPYGNHIILNESEADALAQAHDRSSQVRGRYDRNKWEEWARKEIEYWKGQLDNPALSQRELDDAFEYIKQLRQGLMEQPTSKAVGVPHDLNWLDMDAPLSHDEVQRLDAEMTRQGLDPAWLFDGMKGEHAWNAVWDETRDKGLTSTILHNAGWDGVTYTVRPHSRGLPPEPGGPSHRRTELFIDSAHKLDEAFTPAMAAEARRAAASEPEITFPARDENAPPPRTRMEAMLEEMARGGGGGIGGMGLDEPSRFGLPSLANDLGTMQPRITGGDEGLGGDLPVKRPKAPKLTDEEQAAKKAAGKAATAQRQQAKEVTEMEAKLAEVLGDPEAVAKANGWVLGPDGKPVVRQLEGGQIVIAIAPGQIGPELAEALGVIIGPGGKGAVAAYKVVAHILEHNAKTRRLGVLDAVGQDHTVPSTRRSGRRDGRPELSMQVVLPKDTTVRQARAVAALLGRYALQGGVRIIHPVPETKLRPLFTTPPKTAKLPRPKKDEAGVTRALSFSKPDGTSWTPDEQEALVGQSGLDYEVSPDGKSLRFIDYKYQGGAYLNAVHAQIDAATTAMGMDVKGILAYVGHDLVEAKDYGRDLGEFQPGGPRHGVPAGTIGPSDLFGGSAAGGERALQARARQGDVSFEAPGTRLGPYDVPIDITSVAGARQLGQWAAPSPVGPHGFRTALDEATGVTSAAYERAEELARERAKATGDLYINPEYAHPNPEVPGPHTAIDPTRGVYVQARNPETGELETRHRLLRGPLVNPSVSYQGHTTKEVAEALWYARNRQTPRRLAAVLGHYPTYLGDNPETYLEEMRRKVDEGGFTPFDIARAYISTLSSQGAGLISLDGYRNNKDAPEWMKRALLEPALLDPEQTKLEFYGDFDPSKPTYGEQWTVRPEAMAYVAYETPEGRRRIDALVNRTAGEADLEEFESLFGFAQFRDPYGRNPIKRAGLSELERYKKGNKKAGTRAGDVKGGAVNLRNLYAATDLLNAARDDPDKLDLAFQKLGGVGGGKAPFIGFLLGYAENPTLDARELVYHMSGHLQTADRSRYTDPAHKYHLREVEYLAGQNPQTLGKTIRNDITGMFRDFTEATKDGGYIGGGGPLGEGGHLSPKMYGGLMHWWLWDKSLDQMNTHGGILPAMLGITPQEMARVTSARRARIAAMAASQSRLRGYLSLDEKPLSLPPAGGGGAGEISSGLEEESSRFGLPSLANDINTSTPRITGGGAQQAKAKQIVSGGAKKPSPAAVVSGTPAPSPAAGVTTVTALDRALAREAALDRPNAEALLRAVADKYQQVSPSRAEQATRDMRDIFLKVHGARHADLFDTLMPYADEQNRRNRVSMTFVTAPALLALADKGIFTTAANTAPDLATLAKGYADRVDPSRFVKAVKDLRAFMKKQGATDAQVAAAGLDIIDAEAKRLGGLDFVERIRQADLAAYGASDMPTNAAYDLDPLGLPRYYATQTLAWPEIADIHGRVGDPEKPFIGYMWRDRARGEAGPMYVVSPKHHFGLTSPFHPIHADSELDTIKQMVWGKGVLQGTAAKNLFGELLLPDRDPGLDVGQNRFLAQTSRLVGPNGADRMQTLGLLAGVGKADPVGRALADGTITTPQQFYTALAMGKVGQHNPLFGRYNEARGLPLNAKTTDAEKANLGLGYVPNKFRQEALILDPHAEGIRMFYVRGTLDELLHAEHPGGGGRKVIDVLRQAQARAGGPEVAPIVLYDQTVPLDSAGRPAFPEERSIPEHARVVNPDNTLGPTVAQALPDVAPDRPAIRRAYLGAGLKDEKGGPVRDVGGVTSIHDPINPEAIARGLTAGDRARPGFPDLSISPVADDYRRAGVAERNMGITADDAPRFGLPSLANDLGTANPRIVGGGGGGGPLPPAPPPPVPPPHVNAALETAKDANGLLRAYYAADLMSNIVSNIRNVVFNGFQAFTTPAESTLAAGSFPVAKLLSGHAGAVSQRYGPKEMNAATLGLWRGMGDSLGTAWELWKHGADPNVKVEDLPLWTRYGGEEAIANASEMGDLPMWRSAARNASLPPDLRRGPLAEAAARLFTPISGGLNYGTLRPLKAADEFYKGAIFNQAIAVEFYRLARSKGLGGAAADQFVNLQYHYLLNPPMGTATPVGETLAAVERAAKYARYQTFQQQMDRIGEFLTKIQKFPVAGPFLLPFARTPYNILKYGLERSPVAAVPILHDTLGGKYNPNSRWGRANPDKVKEIGDLQDRLARFEMGLAFTGLAWFLWDQGILQGGGPTDPGKADEWRRQGNMAWSIKLPGGYRMPMLAVPAVGPTFMMTVGALEALQPSVEKGNEPPQGAVEKAVNAFGHAMSGFQNVNILQAWGQAAPIIEAATSREGDLGTKLSSAGNRTASSILAGLMPYSAALRGVTTVEEGAEGGYDRSTPGVTDDAQAVIPPAFGALGIPNAADLEPKRVLGRPIPRVKRGIPSLPEPFRTASAAADVFLNPLSKVEDRTDALDREIIDLGTEVPGVGSSVEGQRLTRAQRERYEALLGQRARAPLEALIRKGDYRKLPPMEREKAFDAITARARAEAKLELLAEGVEGVPTLRDEAAGEPPKYVPAQVLRGVPGLTPEQRALYTSNPDALQAAIALARLRVNRYDTTGVGRPPSGRDVRLADAYGDVSVQWERWKEKQDEYKERREELVGTVPAG